MAKYRINYKQESVRVCYIEADSCMEAKKKFTDFEDVIEDREDYVIDEKIEEVYLDE